MRSEEEIKRAIKVCQNSIRNMEDGLKNPDEKDAWDIFRHELVRQKSLIEFGRYVLGRKSKFDYVFKYG